MTTRSKSITEASIAKFVTTIVVIAACFFPAAAFAAAAPLKIAPTAALQVKTLQAIKTTKTLTQAKISSRLYLASLHEKKDPRLTVLTDFRFLKPEPNTGKIAVDIILSSPTLKPVLNKLESLGDFVDSSSSRYRRVAARVSLSHLEEIAAVPEVRLIRERMPYMTNKVNTSEGDATHLAALARGFYGTSGTGVKIGVLSDGVDSLAAVQSSGDLPAVQILPGQDGSGDEGTAMLEIVHDLAPNADLAFATAVTDEASFAQNILDLAAAGCDIIVDDIIYLDESPFQDGPVAQAVNTVTAAGVLYFSSAGNEGNKADLTSGTWEGDFVPNGTPAALTGAGPVHNFGDGGQSILVEFGTTQTPVVLIWAEHYDLNTGTASTDYDLYDLNGTLTTVFDASTDVQDGSGGDDFPIEFIGGGAFGGERLVVAKFADGTTSSDPMFNLILFRGELDDDLVTGGTTRGHSAAADAFSVAATPVAESFDGVTPDGPYPNPFTSANESESFSSDGPRRIILGPTGAEITPGNRTSTGGVVRQKPDITAADGVATASPGFNPFYGTSAAAPHAAAIAALLKSAVPSMTPAQVRTALLSTAIDIEAPGVDTTTGAGIIMANAALQAAGATPNAFLDDGTPVPTQVMGDGDAYIEPNEIFSLIWPLQNIGGAPATAISAVLSSSTPGVTINTANSTYPDLAVSASANNNTPFVFTVGSAAACGSGIDLTLTVTYSGGSSSPQTFTVPFQLGAPGTPVTFTYSGAAVPIPDGGDLTGNLPGAAVAAAVAVAGLPGNVYDVNLRIEGSACSTATGSTTVGIDHTFVNDLEITLRAPDGTAVKVIDNTDGSGNNFCQTILDDESGGQPIQGVVSANAPFTGTFTPASPLAALHGENGNGNWQLEAQDFFSGDTGNIRAFSLVITPAICDAPPLTANVNGTKTVSGTYTVGSTVTYTVTLTNTGGLPQANNAGSEFVDVLPSSLTLVSASASSGTAVATVGTNTVTWDGSIPAINGSVTITITATINSVSPTTVISNQGTINFDSDANGSNEGSRLTDDPSVGGLTDPTSFTVVGATVTGTKTVAGTFASGGAITYTVTLTNTGNATAADNAGNEFTDVLPSSLTLVSASATSGAALATVGTNTVTWSGAIPPAGSVTITINATVNTVSPGTVVSNQGSISYDSDGNGSNEATGVTDDPSVGGATDPTSFTVDAAVVTGTKTVTGTYEVGGTVTYTITLTNTGNISAGDNPGNEFTDVLPSGLTLVSASASSGTAVATIATNTVTWNGSIPAATSVTITINATINSSAAGTTITNQGTFSYDTDGNGTNDGSGVTDDPGQGGAADGTPVTVAGAALDIVTKSVSGTFTPGSTITYTIVINNTGDAITADNPGDELTDVLPSQLTLLSASATSGSALATLATNTVTWNGSVPPGGSVTITILATIENVPEGTVISNQATHIYDSNGDGANDTTVLSNDPNTAAPNDPTVFAIAAAVPTLSFYALTILGLAIALLAVKVIR
jgi:uncharacterized repeat protein (TIGR01451 family)